MIDMDEYIMRAKKGEEPATSILFRVLGRIARIKYRDKFNYHELEDAVQEALIAALRGVKTFDQSKGISAESFMFLCIERGIIDYIRKKTRRKNDALRFGISLHKQIFTDSPKERHFEERISDGVDYEDQIIKNISFQETLQMLTDLERTVLVKRGEGYSYEQVAEILDKPIKSVDNAYLRAKKKIRIST